MNSNYLLSNLPRNICIDLIRELLNRTDKLNLEPYKGPSNIDLIHLNQDRKPHVLVQVIQPAELSSQSLERIAENITREIEEKNPGRYILIYWHDLPAPSVLKKLPPSFIYYNIRWIEKRLENNRDLLDKYKIQLQDTKLKTAKSYSKKLKAQETKTEKPDSEWIKKLIEGGTNFFALGHKWGHADQTERFLKNGIWENGHKVKLTNVVNRIKSGDVVFLQASYSGYMRIKVIGIVVSNMLDGHKITVKWHPINHTDIPGRGAYRSAISQIGRDSVPIILEELYNRLPELFNIINKLQTEVANVKRGVEKISSDTNENSNRQYWWINAKKEFWNIDKFAVGQTQLYASGSDNVNELNKFWFVDKGDFAIIYQDDTLKAIVEVIERSTANIKEDILVKVFFKFDIRQQFSISDLKHLTFFEKSDVITYDNKGLLYNLTKDEFIGLSTIEEHINFNQEPDESITQQSTAAAHNSNDLAHAEKDLLGFEPDVKVLAALMALKKMEPPLAIALFGKWGTGKSFFMFQLEKKINELSKFQGFLEEKKDSFSSAIPLNEDKYCKGIAQINFNAWSYVDSNLWAGLVSTIFEKLNEYITDSTKSGVAKLKVQSKLGERLKALRMLKETEEGKRERLEKLKSSYEQEAQKLDHEIIKNITDSILDISNENNEVKNCYSRLGIDEDSLTDNFTIQGSRLISEYKYWRNFRENIKKASQLWQYGLLALAGIICSVLITKLLHTDFSAIYSLPAFTVLSKSFTWWRTKKVKIKKYVDKFNTLIDENTGIKEKIDTLEKDIAFVDEQKLQARKQIDELDKQILTAQYDLEENLTETAIHDFIGDRANHKDYKEHLGIVSTIRKDFETLSELFLESHKEAEPTPEKGARKTKKEILNDDRGFIKEQFQEGKKLERIILYIDDLDRCSDEKVLEVLQAVHLIMAFPLFIVVVGVDKRCVNNALNFKNILQYFNSHGVKDLEQLHDEFNIEIIEPNEYLEKIFQIPFQIPDATPDGVRKMIEDLFDGQVNEELELEKESKKTQTEEYDDILDSPDPDIHTDVFMDNATLYLDKSIDPEPDYDVPDETPDEGSTEKEELPEEYEFVPVTPPDLTITPSELEQIKNLSGLVGNVPRTIKRFVNLYRILRAHSQLSHNELSANSKLAIMFALAINIGKGKDNAEKLFNTIEDKKDVPLGDFLTATSYPEFYYELTKNNMSNTLEISCEDINEHLPFIKRFSFGEILNGNNE